ncbi:MAG: recombinase family protein [Pirellulales bacterium]
MKLVAYYRVSTKKQQSSGLGMEAQRECVSRHAAQHNAEIIATFTEVESGKNSDRPELQAAVDRCHVTGATLIVAKLDRLSRSVAFTSKMMESGVKFVCCDMPAATDLTIHILAAVAQQERQATSERTKAALQAAKQRGVLLGSHRPGHWDGREDQRQAGQRSGGAAAATTNRKLALQHKSRMMPVIQPMIDEGLTHTEIARRLNAKDCKTRWKRPWSRAAVKHVVEYE